MQRLKEREETEKCKLAVCTAEATATALREELENVQLTHKERSSVFAKDVEALNHRIQQGELIAEQKAAQIRILETDIQDRNYTIKELNTNVDQLETMSKELRERLDVAWSNGKALETAKAELETLLAASQSRVTELEGSLETFKTEAVVVSDLEMQERIAATEGLLEEKKAEILQFEQALLMAQDVIETQVKKTEQLEGEVFAANELIASLQADRELSLEALQEGVVLREAAEEQKRAVEMEVRDLMAKV